MSTTFKVKFWEIKKRAGRKRPWAVRWLTDKKEHSEWYANKPLATGRLSELMQAVRDGEPFDVETGLPVSELRRRNSLSFLEFSQSYMDLKWPDAAATTRGSTVEALATAAAAFVKDGVGRPSVTELRGVLSRNLLPPTTRDLELSGEEREVVDWLVRNSRPLFEVTDAVLLRGLLDALASKLDGKAAAATVYQRKRAVLFNLLSYAVERELIPDNPLTRVKRKAAKVVEQVDPRVVANPGQVARLLTAVTYVGRRNLDRGAHLAAFFGTGYYAAARPAEGLALREDDCTLPEEGWGLLMLGESRPAAGKRWTDSGEVHDRRGLKHRGRKEVRPVPIPPVLVHILRDHLDRYGAGPDGRLFRSLGGGVVSSSTYYRVWEEARQYALTPAQVASPLAARPYDLRHAAVSLWLNGGVPATEVAERAGHSVDVLLKVYAKCIDGQRETVNKTIEGLFEA
ncbi:tyrosine-type recombinase/integrase [Saccharothrix variisporea]|uniref:Site-specific recombinase XerD n=1 Tax=Saccharothrix variisporea TaxID=543527 RepID=A0A495XA47_9PSEU|nr:tyrosine-type recombinase/integrase [Saccharothrix variisporea]RKT70872.1 site-specific recombinase XerD [Saccharothrix variisporea]